MLKRYRKLLPVVALEYVVHRVEHNADNHINHSQKQRQTSVNVILIWVGIAVKAQEIRQHTGQLQADRIDKNEVQMLHPSACVSFVHCNSLSIRGKIVRLLVFFHFLLAAIR